MVTKEIDEPDLIDALNQAIASLDSEGLVELANQVTNREFQFNEALGTYEEVLDN